MYVEFNANRGKSVRTPSRAGFVREFIILFVGAASASLAQE